MTKIQVEKTLFIKIVLIGIVIILNYVSVLIVNIFKIPLFLDTWGTSLGVLIGGFGVGAIGGILYNLLMAATVWGPSAWIWSISSLWVAISTYFFFKRGFINLKNLKKLVGAGMVIGFTSALITFAINVVIFNSLPTYGPTAAINNFFFVTTESHEIASFLEHVVVEFFDKTISLTMAAGIASIIPYQFVPRKGFQKQKKLTPSICKGFISDRRRYLSLSNFLT